MKGKEHSNKFAPQRNGFSLLEPQDEVSGGNDAMAMASHCELTRYGESLRDGWPLLGPCAPVVEESESELMEADGDADGQGKGKGKGKGKGDVDT